MLLFLLLLIVAKEADGVKRCFECKDAPHPADCRVITFCPDADLCMTREFVTSGGLILYSSGCESKSRCSSLGKRQVSRRDTDIVVCEECCQGDFCNMDGCGVSTPKLPQRGPFCLSCSDEDDPFNCRHATQCQQDEVCSVKQVFNHNADGIVRFQSECIRDRQCAALALTSQTQNICFQCCTGDFCNDNCNITSSNH